ncbi:hypothetical protein RIF29_25023 [Crotalaria pallida]|uniref:Uncharacterized protein n=1 Tax=Crotalaria pallida TaxID=3830 RepID=A0AAN9ELK0_CROPI
MDLAALDDVDLDNLSPKQAEQLLECLDGLRLRLKKKDSKLTGNEIGLNVSGNSEKEEPSNPNNSAADNEIPRMPNLQTALDEGLIPSENVDRAREDVNNVITVAIMPIEFDSIAKHNSEGDKGKSTQDEPKEGDLITVRTISKV